MGEASDRAFEQSSGRTFALVITSIFLLLQLVAILHHQMWRDELQIWMLARHSDSISQLISLKRYEGHPDAWFLIIFIITRLTTNPVGMKLVHLCIASATAYTMARYSPFTRTQKTLMIFGYFLFFEYATVSRGYALGILFLFIFCASFRPGPRKNYVLLALLLALMCQTSIYGVMIAFGVTVAILFEAIRSFEPKQFLFPNTRRVVIALLVLLVSVCLSALHMIPPKDSAIPWSQPFMGDFGARNFARSFSMFWNSFVPVPLLRWEFWGTNLLWGANVWHGHGAMLLVVPLSILICGFSILFFIRKPVALLAYTSGIGALFFFKYLKYFGALRHDGHLFILFLACLWLASYFPDEHVRPLKLERVANWFAPFQSGVLVGVLTVHAAMGLAVSVLAFRVPFSEGKAVADLIHSRHMEQMFIVGDVDAPASTVAGYLDREIFYIREERMGSFILWDKKRLVDADQPVTKLANTEASERSAEVLMILSYRLEAIPFNMRELASFPRSMSGEDYFLYVVQPDKR